MVQAIGRSKCLNSIVLSPEDDDLQPQDQQTLFQFVLRTPDLVTFRVETSFDSSAIQQIARCCKNLRTIDITNIDEMGLLALANNCPLLETAHFSSTAITGNSL